MKAIHKRAALLAIAFFSFFQLNAQMKLLKFEFGVLINSFIYQGDLTPSKIGSYKTLKLGPSFFFSHSLTDRISLRTNLTIGKLKGDDAKYSYPDWRKERALAFETPVIEISELAVVNIFSDTKISPYGFGGVGLTILNINRDWSRFNSQFFSNQPKTLNGLTADIQHDVPKRIIVLPVGMGARYPLSERFSLVAETSYRFTFTDYLDGFSEVANPAKKDYYFTHSLGITYRPGGNSSGSKKRLDCPVF